MKKKDVWQYTLVGIVFLLFAGWFLDGREDKTMATALVILAFYIYVQEQRINRQAEFVNALNQEVFQNFDRLEKRLQQLELDVGEPERRARYNEALSNLTRTPASNK